MVNQNILGQSSDNMQISTAIQDSKCKNVYVSRYIGFNLVFDSVYTSQAPGFLLW